MTDAIVEEAKTFIASARNNDKPFFAYLPFSAPHTPFQARKEGLRLSGACQRSESTGLPGHDPPT